MARGTAGFPAPRTDSAREARKSFFCDLCQKGYSRMNEYDAHESSYDHQHKKRLRDMKQMQRDPSAADRARRSEYLDGELTGVSRSQQESARAAITGGGSSTIKKGTFKSITSAKNSAANFHDLSSSTTLRPQIPTSEESLMSRSPKATHYGSMIRYGDCHAVSYTVYDPRRPTSP